MRSHSVHEKPHNLILESFNVDLHVVHVRRAVNRLLGQRLKDFRCTLHSHYKKLPEGVDKQLYPHEDVNQADWAGMCEWFESDEFKKISEKNTTSRRLQKDNHCCGSKPFVRYREELIDQETQEEPGRVSMYHHTRFSKKKGCWVSPVAEQNYNAMNAIQSTPTPTNSVPLTEDQVYDKVMGVRRGYVHGLGHGQDPMPASFFNELDNNQEAQRYTQEAKKRAEEAERQAAEAQRRFEESENRLEESEKRTEEKLNAMQAQMLNFMAQFQGCMAPFQSGMAPFSGSMAPFPGGMAPFSGGIAPFLGGMAPFQGGSMMSLLVGERQIADGDQ